MVMMVAVVTAVAVMMMLMAAGRAPPINPAAMAIPRLNAQDTIDSARCAAYGSANNGAHRACGGIAPGCALGHPAKDSLRMRRGKPRRERRRKRNFNL